MRTSHPLPSALRQPLAVGDARDLGLTARRLRSTDLHRPFHGVVAARPLDFRGRCRAYAQRLPPGGFFSGPTAALLHGLPLPSRNEREDAPLHVSVPGPAEAPRGRGVIGHSVRLHLGDVATLSGLAVSSTARTWCELGTLLTVEELVVVGDAISHRRAQGATADQLRAAVDSYPGRRGRRRLSEALELIDDRAESPQESRLRVRLIRAGVTGLTVNLRIPTTTGPVYRADLAFPEHRVILEYQGDHHRELSQYRADLTRLLDLQTDGWTVVYLGPDDIRNEGLATRVRAILAMHPTQTSRARPG
jgi:very-short-patch-repair endonuclease